MTKTSPSQIDVHIGNKLKLARMKAGKNLQEVGDILGVSFQQIQKYERGQNKISSSNIFIIAQYLEMDLSYFFKGLSVALTKEGLELNEPDKEFKYDNKTISEQELSTLVRHYSTIANIKDRKKVLEVIKSISSVLATNPSLESETAKTPDPLPRDVGSILELVKFISSELAANPVLESEVAKSVSSVLAVSRVLELAKNITTVLESAKTHPALNEKVKI